MEKYAKEALERVRKEEAKKWEDRSRSKVRQGGSLLGTKSCNKENSA